MKRTIMQLYGIDDKRITVVKNGPDRASFSDEASDSSDVALLRRRLGLVSDNVVVFAGRFSPEKGVSGLLRSAMHITAKYHDVVYLIAGERPLSEYTHHYEALITSHPRLRTQVRLLGRQDRDELRLLYRVSKIAVVPSIVEVFPYSALEAMISGVAVIASDIDGLPEMIENERCGLLVPLIELGNGLYDVQVPKLVEAQERLLKDPALAAKLGAAGRARVLEHFSYETMLRRTLEIYEGILCRGSVCT